MIRSGSTLLRLAIACLFLLPAGAVADDVGTPGETDLLNLEHVFNHRFAPEGQASGGTDVEFFASTVPVRGEDGQIVLDASGAPVTAEREFAVVGAHSRGAFLFDVTDLPAVQHVATIPCEQAQNDVQVRRFGARWVLALASDISALCVRTTTGSRPIGGISLFDVTDPVAWQPMVGVRSTGGAHNFTFHPTKPYGWVSNGDLPGGRSFLPIIDFTNLSAPTTVTTLSSVGGPHDVTFDASGTRAYVASENNLRIYDTTDPAAPVQLGTGVNATTYLHDATPSPDGELLVATGESLTLGGFFAQGMCPGEGLTVYTISGELERAPVPVGYYLPHLAGPVPAGRACTAHNGRFAGPRTYVMAWYIGGARVIDLSVPSAPREIGRAVLPDTNSWSARPYKGYVFVGDGRRGLDVYRWTGPGSL